MHRKKVAIGTYELELRRRQKFQVCILFIQKILQAESEKLSYSFCAFGFFDFLRFFLRCFSRQSTSERALTVTRKNDS